MALSYTASNFHHYSPLWHSPPAARTCGDHDPMRLEAGGGWDVPLAVVEPEGLEAHVVPQPLEPIGEVFAHKLLRVVDVGGALELVTDTRVALAATDTCDCMRRYGCPEKDVKTAKEPRTSNFEPIFLFAFCFRICV